MEIIPNYEFVLELGSGSFGSVARAKHSHTGINVAIKEIQKVKSNRQFLRTEIKALKELCHPNICQLHEVVETQLYVYLVMQLCQKGSLGDYIKDNGRLNEELAQKIFGQTVAAVNYVLEKGYCHRDIKPHNIMLDSDMTVKLIDFGLAVEIREAAETGVKPAGSILYAAPEAFDGGKYDLEKADIWSLGVMLYEMLTSDLPFKHHNLPTLYSLIKSGQYETPSYFSSETTSILKQLIEVDATKRISCKDLMAHPWLSAQDLKTESHGVCLDKDNLDEECISKMCEQYTVSEQKMKDMVAEWKFDDITANYIMTLQKMKSGNESSSCDSLIDEFELLLDDDE